MTFLQHCHDSAVGGHFGLRKTLRKVKQKYYCPGPYTYVEQYVKSCDTCAKRKQPIWTNRAPMQLTGAGYPMERIAMDSLRLLPVTSND